MTYRLPALGATALCVLLGSAPAWAQQPPNIDVVQGRCDPSSHLAEGAVGSDLTKRHQQYFCDIAIITWFDDVKGHVLVQFAERQSHRAQVIGFAGIVQPDGIMMIAPKVYFTPGQQPTRVDFGTCKFFFKGRHMDGIFCGAKVDEQGRRTVASIVFNAAPGQ